MYVRSLCLEMGALVALGCGADAPVPEPPLRPVRTIEVQSVGGERSRTFSGVARAEIQSTLSFRVSGNIQRLLVRTGDRVEAGQLIAELDPTEYELRVQEAEADLIQAEARARQSDAEYSRMRGLYENRNASRSDLDASRAAAESTRARIDASRHPVPVGPTMARTRGLSVIGLGYRRRKRLEISCSSCNARMGRP